MCILYMQYVVQYVAYAVCSILHVVCTPSMVMCIYAVCSMILHVILVCDEWTYDAWYRYTDDILLTAVTWGRDIKTCQKKTIYCKIYLEK